VFHGETSPNLATQACGAARHRTLTWISGHKLFPALDFFSARLAGSFHPCSPLFSAFLNLPGFLAGCTGFDVSPRQRPGLSTRNKKGGTYERG
jgi:hypothetical protein